MLYEPLAVPPWPAWQWLDPDLKDSSYQFILEKERRQELEDRHTDQQMRPIPFRYRRNMLLIIFPKWPVCAKRNWSQPLTRDKDKDKWFSMAASYASWWGLKNMATMGKTCFQVVACGELHLADWRSSMRQMEYMGTHSLLYNGRRDRDIVCGRCTPNGTVPCRDRLIQRRTIVWILTLSCNQWLRHNGRYRGNKETS